MTDLLQSEKENIAPTVVSKQLDEDTEVKQMKVSSVDEAKKVNSESTEVPKEAPIEAVDEEKKESVVKEADTNKPDLSEFTEQRIFDDLNELQESGKIDGTTMGKKSIRTILEEHYNLKKKALKKHDAFLGAIDQFSTKMTEIVNAQNEEIREDEPKKEKKDKKKSKNKKKDKDKKKKSRKRKHPSDDDENKNDEESAKDPPKKKRKTNSGKSVVDKDEETNENMDESEENEEETNNDKKEKKKRGKKKKSVPGNYTLRKLRKILRATGNANPKFYKDLKDKPNKKQIALIKEVLTEKEIDFSDLSEKGIKKLKSEWDLKREMAELGIDTSKKNEDEEEEQYADGITLSSRRPRRNVSRVSYKQKLPKFEEENSENEDDENGDGKNEAEEAEENEASSDEEDVYEPPSDEDEDDDYEM